MPVPPYTDMLQRLMAKQEAAKSMLDQILASAKVVDERTKAIDARTKEIDERTRVIVDLSIGTQKALARGVNELKHHITTAADNTLPTIFVIVPKEQNPTDIEEILEEAKAAQQAFHEGKKLKTGEKLLYLGLKCADKVGKLYGTVTAVASDPVGTIKSKVKYPVALLSALYTLNPQPLASVGLTRALARTLTLDNGGTRYGRV